jgi:hypothetical protein
MYSYCLSNTMAGKLIEVEPIMTIWSCYISTCKFPYEVHIYTQGKIFVEDDISAYEYSKICVRKCSALLHNILLKLMQHSSTDSS